MSINNIWNIYTAIAKSLQLCPTPCDPVDGSPPRSSIPGILQARTLEWVAVSFSNALKWKVKVKLLSCVQLFVTQWTIAYQAPPSMGFSREEYWNRLQFPSPGHLPDPGILPKSPASQAGTLLTEPPIYVRPQMLSHVWFFATSGTVAYQAVLSMGFSQQEYWSRLLFSPAGIFPTKDGNLISYIFCIGKWVLYH